jgi:hypothetical protein
VTLSGLAVTDVEIYKNGSTTQRASDAGVALLDTDGIDFDGLTGINGFAVDLSDNTDSGFYTVGGFYWVVVSSVTIDSQTVNFIAATFRIAEAEVATGRPSVGVASVANNAITASAIATDAIGAAQLAADAIAEINSTVDTALADYDGPTHAELVSEIDAVQTDIAALNDISVSQVLTTQMTESYAANGGAPTLAQAVLAIHQYLMYFSISGTAYTVKQLGGSDAFAVTLNDDTAPTAATRA